MGLFINSDRYPDVFNNKESMIEPNQVVYRTDLVTEWLSEQRRAQESLNNRLTDFEKQTRQQNHTYMNQGRMITHRFEELTKNNARHQRFEMDVLASIKKLNTKNNTIQTLLTNGRSLNMEFITQMNRLNESSKEITEQLGNFDVINEHFSKSMAAQNTNYEQLEQQIIKLENAQAALLSRFDRQEGLIEKVVRQVDHIRSVIFERSHFIVGKIEKMNKLTSSHRAKRKTGSERSIKLQKIEEEQKNN